MEFYSPTENIWENVIVIKIVFGGCQKMQTKLF